MGWKIGGSLGKFWEDNKGTIVKTAGTIGGGIAGTFVGNPMAGAAAGGALASALNVKNRDERDADNATKAQNASTATEMADLQKRRQAGLDDLEKNYKNPYQAPLVDNPTAGVNYNAPTVAPRNTTLLDKATSMQRPSGVIANDAMDELRGRGEFNYADRAPNDIQNDALGDIRNFKSGQGSLASQFAMQGYPGAGGPAAGSASVGSRDVTAMNERANVDELMAFDPSSAFEKYVTGAQGQFDETLKTNNERLTQTAAGGGRLNTGFFDLDRGELGRQLSADARNSMQQKALDTNAQKLAAITSGTDIRAGDLNSLRQQYLDAESGNADRSLRAGQTTAEIGSRAGIAAADRDADFRSKALGYMGDAENRSLDALDTARGYQVGDQKRTDDLFTGDRNFKQGSFNDYNDVLAKASTTQRADRSRLDDLFKEDRDYLTDADKQTNDYYENDRDYNLDAWGQENANRFKDRSYNSADREFTQGVHDDALTNYYDLLAGNSDRAQNATNAAQTNAANRANSRNQLYGQLAGVAGAAIGRRTPGTTTPAKTTSSGGAYVPSGAGAINPAAIDSYTDPYSPDAIENWRRPVTR